MGAPIERRRRPGLRILMYHRFPASEVPYLEQQCQHLRQHYRPVSMSEIAESVTTGKPLPTRAVAVTVDDGYRDFADHTAPVLQKYGISATVFPITSFLDRESWPWWDVVGYVFERTSRVCFEWDDRTLPLSTPEERSLAARQFSEYSKTLPNGKHRRSIASLGAQLGVEVPQELSRENLPLSWDQVRELKKHGFEFGGHTVTHPILSKVETVEELRTEIQRCKSRIEEETDAPVIHFCYPNGRVQDIDGRAVAEVCSAKYTTAVTAVAQLNDGNESPFLFRRYAIYNKMPLAHFSQLVAGMHDEPLLEMRGYLPA